MKLLKTAALLVGWVYFAVVGTVMYLLLITGDTLMTICKVWKKPKGRNV